MWPTLFIVKFIYFFENQENIDYQMFVIYFNGKTLTTLLLQILLTKKNIYIFLIVHISFPLPVGKIWAYMDRLYCPKRDFKYQLPGSGPKA